MVSIYQSNNDTDSEPHELQERYETNSDDEKVKKLTAIWYNTLYNEL